MEYDHTPGYTILFWLVGALMVYLILFAQAVSAQVIITEVYPAPPTGDHEWLEFYNASSESVSLAGWSVEDQLTTPSVLKQWTSDVIEPFSYLVIDLTTAKLNNAADGVTLKDASGAVIDTMSYASSEPSKSWSLIAGSWTLTDPTKGSANPPPSPSPSPQPSPSPSASPTPSPSPSPANYATAALALTAIYACPETGEAEWLELKNNSSQTISLTGWKLKDATATIKQLTEETIAAQGKLKIELSSSRLNNTGDTVTLEAPDGTIAFEESYTSCTKGLALVKINNSWQPEGTQASPSPAASPSSAASSSAAASSFSSGLGFQAATSPDTALMESALTSLAVLPGLDTAIDSGLPALPSLDLAAPEPDILGASSAIIGGLLVSASNGLYLARKLSHAQQVP